MKTTIKIDINELRLCTILESMTSFTYSNEVSEKLQNFINYLIDNIYHDNEHMNFGDIVSEEYYCITTYERENS